MHGIPRSRPLRFLVLVVCLICVLLPCHGAAIGENPVYTFAVLPQRPPVVMYSKWRPLLDSLEKETGVTLKLKLYENVADFETDIGKGGPDFIFSTPPQLVIARKIQGYNPLVRSSRMLSAILFVRKDSPIRTVNDLQSGEIAFTGSWNVCSILMHQVLVKDHPDLKFKQLYAGSSSNVVSHVLLGKATAGSVLDSQFENMAPEANRDLRPVLETPKIFAHPISAHPRVPKQLQEKLAAAMLHLWGQDKGKAILLSLGITNPVRANYQHDYRQLEEIDLTFSGKE